MTEHGRILERLTMRGVMRPLCVFVLLQGVCLAAGLWIHDRFLISTARWQHGHSANQSGARPASGAETSYSAREPSVQGASENEAQRLYRAMPAASLIAFAWTFGLQAAIAYFLFARVHGDQSRQQSISEEQSLRQMRDLLQTRDAVIFGLAKLAESRDPDTGHHLERISLYSKRLASALSRVPKYRAAVTPAFVRLISISSALHDIGKVGIEDSVLLKPGQFTGSERLRMQLHAEVGAETIRVIERRLGTSNFLEMAREIARSHHERWDGAGYPDGLAGEEIPLAARIVAIADVYDALSVRRVYKDPIPHEKCIATIRDDAGRHFDPDLVQVLLSIESQFQEIASRFADLARADDQTSQSDIARIEANKLTPEQQVLLASLAESDEISVPEPFRAGKV